MSKTFLGMNYLEMSGSDHLLAHRNIPDEPNSQIGMSFVRRNALHSETSALGTILQEPSSVSQSDGSKHTVFSPTNINKGLLPQWQRCPTLPHEAIQGDWRCSSNHFEPRRYVEVNSAQCEVQTT
jgi:hypothetical protein